MGVWLGIVGIWLGIVAKAPDFQAEYEGSIPFTRSNVFNDLACERFQVPTSI